MADGNDRKVILQRKIQDVLADRSKINYIVDIIDELSGSDTLVVVECIDGLGKIFTKLIQSGTCPVKKASKVSSKKAKIADQPEEIFAEWITQSYDQTVKTLLALLQSPCHEIAEKALCTVMVFLKAESQKLQESSQGFAFSSDLFLKLVTKLTGCLYTNDAVVKFFKPYLRYNDICYYTLRNLTKIISKFTDDQQQGDINFARSVYRLLMLISVPTCEDDLGNLFVIFTEETEPHPKTIKHNVMNLNSYKKVFTRAWMAFLALTLDNGLYRQVLVVLEDKVIPHLVDPKILMDFLVDSYNIGGVTSILALNSLFVLIHKYNLDYPDFYKKLYSLLQAEIFHMKYRARFFFLADLFLMSTHLPAYLVAAFIKRLSRIALRVPPYGVALIVKFVGNLIRRHPNCKVLIHRKKDKNVQMNGNDLASQRDEKLADPFKEDEADPSQCEALQSSLWELETLRQHYYPEIKSLVELLEKPIGKTETDMSDCLESSYETFFDNECTEFTKSNAYVEYHMPSGLLSDSLNELWCIEQ